MPMFGPYRLDGLIGAGGMGEVHRAYDTEQERAVALKILPAGLSGDDEYRQRFRREARLASQLNDPHVVPIHRHGEISGQLFLEMRLVEGEDLATVLAGSGPLPPAETARVVEQVAGALDAAHDAGLVHRDVKPANVFLTRARAGSKRFAYLGDFGIARVLNSAGTSLTATNATIGTLAYMAPERFTDDAVDARIDVYSLACVLYECLTGRRPFPGQELPKLMHGHLSQPPPAPSRHHPALAAFDPVVARGMAKDPGARYQSAGELAAAVQEAAVRPAPTAGPGFPQPAGPTLAAQPARPWMPQPGPPAQPGPSAWPGPSARPRPPVRSTRAGARRIGVVDALSLLIGLLGLALLVAELVFYEYDHLLGAVVTGLVTAAAAVALRLLAPDRSRWPGVAVHGVAAAYTGTILFLMLGFLEAITTTLAVLAAVLLLAGVALVPAARIARDPAAAQRRVGVGDALVAWSMVIAAAVSAYVDAQSVGLLWLLIVGLVLGALLAVARSRTPRGRNIGIPLAVATGTIAIGSLWVWSYL